MDDGRTGGMTVGRPGREGGRPGNEQSSSTNDRSGVRRRGGGAAVGRGAGHAAAEMMRLASAISTCTAPPMRNVSNEKHGARGEGNLLSFGVQCGGEWLRSLAPMGGRDHEPCLPRGQERRKKWARPTTQSAGHRNSINIHKQPDQPALKRELTLSPLSLLAQMKERLNIGNRCRFAFLA